MADLADVVTVLKRIETLLQKIAKKGGVVFPPPPKAAKKSVRRGPRVQPLKT